MQIAEQLVAAIKEDQTELLPARIADEFRRSETERQQAKQREAEKRKREAAAMDMPPPDSWSVVTGRNRSRAIQSSSRLDPGEGHSRWGEPSRKKLAAKATMGPTGQLFQKGEKEKSANEGGGRVFSSQVQVQVQVQKGEKEKGANADRGYDPNYPGYTSQMVSGSGTPYTPETERVSPPPRQPAAPPRHTLDLTALVAAALGDVTPHSRNCEEDSLFDDAVRTPCPPGTEDDVVMEGDLDDLEAAKRFLDEDDQL